MISFKLNEMFIGKSCRIGSAKSHSEERQLQRRWEL